MSEEDKDGLGAAINLEAQEGQDGLRKPENHDEATPLITGNSDLTDQGRVNRWWHSGSGAGDAGEMQYKAAANRSAFVAVSVLATIVVLSVVCIAALWFL